MKGQVGKIDYRLVVAKPYAPSTSTTLTHEARVAPTASDYQLSSYIKIHLKDKESQKSPFAAATYLGKKDLLTFGVGAFYQPEATSSLFGTDTVHYGARSFAADLFYEHPVYQKTTITLYAAYFNHDLGPDFIRQVGANNPAETHAGSGFLNGKGNSALVTGTGQIYFLQGAILKSFQSRGFQLYGSCAHADMQALSKRLVHWETGINYLIDGHRSKLTLGYQNWPLVKKVGDRTSTEDRGHSIILQYQFKIG